MKAATLWRPRAGGAAGLAGFVLFGVEFAAPGEFGRLAGIVGWLAVAGFWLGLYVLLRQRHPALALLGAAGGVLSSAVEIAAALGTPGFGGLLTTALRVPRVGCIGLALLDGTAPRHALAWWGLLVAALTAVELALWLARGSPNDPLPVGFAAAALGTLWEVAVAAWLFAGAAETTS